jgi:hypothetical protein
MKKTGSVPAGHFNFSRIRTVKKSRAGSGRAILGG